MRVIAPITITDTALAASSIPEDDGPEWAAGTTYAKNYVVKVTSLHRAYRSVGAGNVGNNPTVDDGTNWLDLGATNRWRVFDSKLNNLTTGVGSITYEIVPDKMVSAVGLLNIGANYITVETKDGAGNTLFRASLDRFSDVSIFDYWTFFTVDISGDDVTDIIFDNVIGYPGNSIFITLEGTTPLAGVSIGQIVLGQRYVLGNTRSGTTIGIKDFSSKDRDQFGNAIIVERAFADTVNFQFVLKTEDARRVKMVLASLRATPALYFADASLARYGSQVFGFFQDFDIPLDSAGVCFATLKVEGLA